MPKAYSIFLILISSFTIPCFAQVGSSLVPNTVGIIAPGQFVAPASVQGQSSWLSVTQIHQETNLCVPTSASMVLQYYGVDDPPRELKVWSRGLQYDPSQPFNDFTETFFAHLISGLAAHGIVWSSHAFTNDDLGYQSGLQQIEQQLDGGHPVMVDTSLYTGHTFVVAGYDNSKQVVIVVDPFIAAPGLREISFDAFEKIWNSSKVGSNMRGSIFTTSP